MMNYQLLTEYFNSFKDFMEDDFIKNRVKIVESYKINYEKTKEMLDLAKKLGPEYEALVKLNMNSVYGVGSDNGAISDNASMCKQEMFNDNASMHKQEMFNDHSHRRSVQ